MARVNAPGALPATVDVINRGDTPQTVKNVTLTDSLTASAVYHTTASGGGDVLHVQASSSDGQLAPTSLTVDGFNKALGTAGSVDIATLAPPDQVTVKSSEGRLGDGPRRHRRRRPRGRWRSAPTPVSTSRSTRARRSRSTAAAPPVTSTACPGALRPASR